MRKEMLSVVLCGTFFVFQASVASDLDDFDPFNEDWSKNTVEHSPPISEHDENDGYSQKDLVPSDDERNARHGGRYTNGFGYQYEDDQDGSSSFSSSFSTTQASGSGLLGSSLGKSPHARGIAFKPPYSSPHPSHVMSPVRGLWEEERPSSTPPPMPCTSNPLSIAAHCTLVKDPFQADQDEVKSHRLRSQSRKNPENLRSRSKDPLSASAPSEVPPASLPAPSAFDAPAHGHD